MQFQSCPLRVQCVYLHLLPSETSLIALHAHHRCTTSPRPTNPAITPVEQTAIIKNGGIDSLGRLAGIPTAVKDLEDVRGMPTTFGLIVTDTGIVAAEDSVQVARLRNAGCAYSTARTHATLCNRIKICHRQSLPHPTITPIATATARS